MDKIRPSQRRVCTRNSPVCYLKVETRDKVCLIDIRWMLVKIRGLLEMDVTGCSLWDRSLQHLMELWCLPRFNLGHSSRPWTCYSIREQTGWQLKAMSVRHVKETNITHMQAHRAAEYKERSQGESTELHTCLGLSGMTKSVFKSTNASRTLNFS